MSRIAVMNNKFIPSDFLPIGFLGYIPYANIPDGWLICDGAIYNIADYSELASKLGNLYGGDGVTTFAVPDDRGLFRRGLDLSKGDDPSRTLGSRQEDAFQGHWHGLYSNAGAGAGAYPSLAGSSLSGGTPDSYHALTPSGKEMVHGAITDESGNGTPRTSNETRPKNRAYVPIIKAKNIYYDLSIQGGNAASLGGNPASYYAAASQVVKNTDFISSFGANGYEKLPSGLIMQWGTISPLTVTSFSVVFPTAFLSAVYNVDISSLWPNNGNLVEPSIKAYSLTGFDSYHGSATTGFGIFWKALGK